MKILSNQKIFISLYILCLIIFILGLHGGSEYYFRDFCVHKTLNMFYSNGSPEFFKKPSFVSDIQAIAYGIYYLFLKKLSVINNFNEFTRLFTTNTIYTDFGEYKFMFPALLINNIFAGIGVCFTFLTTYILIYPKEGNEKADKKIIPAFISGFILATSYLWMQLSHHLAVDIPLAALCIVTVYFALYFIRKNSIYTIKNIIVLGILSGLCAATKYNGAIILIVPLIVLLSTQKPIKKCILDIFILFTSALATFLITNPFILLNFNHFFNDFLYEYNHAFTAGHTSADACNSLLFHVYHSFPNAFGYFAYICSVIGLFLFLKNKDIPKEYKFILLSFPVSFVLLMSLSKLIFLRYILPLLPFMAIFIGILADYYFRIKKQKILCGLILLVIASLIVINSMNAIHFFKIMSHEDTRVSIKHILKEIKISPEEIISYSDIFSNPYYEEDVTGKYDNVKDNVKQFLENACNNSIDIIPQRDKKIIFNNNIIIFDSPTHDRPFYTQEFVQFENLENQYLFYDPYSIDYFSFYKTNRPLYIVQINPYKTDKSNVPFDILRSDFKYRNGRGPFVEIYFKSRKYHHEFLKKCYFYQLNCKSVNKEDSYYYKNLIRN